MAARAVPRREVALPQGVIKVNIGAGIEVAPGWINVDGSIHALAARLPTSVLAPLYRRTNSVRQRMTEAEYIARLHDHRFVFHNLEEALPFASESVDFIFCSHVLEHFYRSDALRLAREMLRVLKPGGSARIAVPDLAKAIETYQTGARHEALMYFYTDGREGSYDQHRYMYDFTLMDALLREAGFTAIERRGYREGAVPDLELLDNRPEHSLFVEARARG